MLLVVSEPHATVVALSRDSWFGQRKRRAFGIQRGDGLVDSLVERVRVSEGLMRQMMRLEIAPDGVRCRSIPAHTWAATRR